MDDQSDTTPPADPPSYSDSLVGEGKKYSNFEDLAKAYTHADGFINQLQGETGLLREELDKRMTLEEILAEKQEAQANPTATPEVEEPVKTPPTNPQDVANKDLDLGAEIRRVMQEESLKNKVENNSNAVYEALLEAYGDKSKIQEAVKRKAEELGMPIDTLMSVGSHSPKGFYELMGLTTANAPTPAGTTHGDINPSALAAQRPNNGNGPKHGTDAYYKELRKTDPKKWISSSIQNEMMKAVQRDRDAYYS